MDDDDVALRNLTYRMFVDLGRAPSLLEVATMSKMDANASAAGWQRLHDGHAIVLHSGTSELRMVNPFAAQPTAYRVQAAGRSWFANCAWDAFGICAALDVDGRIETICADCGTEITVYVRDQHPDDQSLMFHCLVPARQWWDDIVFS